MTELQEILKIIQFQTEFNFSQIAKRIHYSREHMSISNKSGVNDKMLSVLKEKFKDEISQFVRSYGKPVNSTQLGRALHPDRASALADLHLIMEAAARIEEGLEQKDRLESGIEAAFENVARKVNKGTSPGKGKKNKP